MATVTGTNANNNLSGTTSDDVMYGLDGDDSLSGLAGNDTIYGGAGADKMTGSTGNDVYYLDTTLDVIVENLNEGTDTVVANVGYTLGANVENLILDSAADDGIGNTLNNAMTGNSGRNMLTGLAGNDTLDGGTGIDTLVGGTGDDTFVINTTGETVTELASEGTDQVNSAVTYTLGSNLENLVLTGTSNTNGTGNTLNNKITGNAGNNTLSGGTGADTMIGGDGADTYIVDNAGDVVTEAGVDGAIDTVKSSVTFTLGSNLENLTLTGTAAINGTGNALNNSMVGNSAANTLTAGVGNDTLDGAAGADSMIGGTGDDIYIVENTGDRTDETGGSGIDLVKSSVSFTLATDVENLTLTGSSAINGTGNSLANVLLGNAYANILDGAGGADSMTGGKGNDTYIVDDANDKTIELAGEGVDHVKSSISWTLVDYVDNLTLTGSSDINGTGNAQNNKLTGNDGKNVLDGAAGVDTMVGGLGDDTYIIDTAGEVVTEAAGAGIDTVKSSVNYTLAANVETLILQGGATNGTGNTLANTIQGNDLDNILNGAAGADTMVGGKGSDTYTVDNVGDVVDETSGDGIDLVKSSVSYTIGAGVEVLQLTGTSAISGTGNSGNNTIIGNSGANILNGGDGDDTIDGGLGADKMDGGNGSDVYIVNSASDVAVDNGPTGFDLVGSTASYTLGAGIEDLVLLGTSAINGTGNTLANIIVGNTANNVINGGAGDDTMAGDAGNDTYVVDHVNDIIEEFDGEGTDTIQTTVSYIMAEYVENMMLMGTIAINGTGNALDNIITGNNSNNVIDGDDGNDMLDGGTGNDTLIGGDGNDTYVVNATGDVVSELGGAGDIDTVKSAVTFTLGANLENLTLIGTGGIGGTGNSLDNLITGNSGNNTLTGNDGNDTLNGGTGSDKLFGGNGDDTYVVNSTGDVVSEAGAGTDIDTVLSTITYTLGATLENLTLTGTAAVNGTGNAADNLLTGNSGGNKLSGMDGADTLDGGDGADTLTGGNGIDTFLRHGAGEGVDTITDFQLGLGGDILDIADLLVGYDAVTSDLNDFVQCVTVGGDTTVQVDVDGAANGVMFVSIAIMTGVATDAATMAADGNLVLS
jgi:Ca2+-binding RTX toxin-like protein